MNASKVIIINKLASKKKYGSKWLKIEAALNKLVKADKKRNVTSQVIPIDSKTAMKAVSGKPVEKATSAIQVKRAIDAMFKSIMPHYILLVGGPDLIPYVKMNNPIISPKEDPDVPSDLPYACDAPYSLSIEKFVGPTRVLGRLPDVPGESDPAYLIKLLDVASKWSTGTSAQYKNYFGVTAEVWKESSRKNVRKLFGTTKKLKICPADVSPWTKAELKPRMHFINCHGASGDAGFYGDPGNDPLGHYSDHITGKITSGTIVTAECCYGAMVYEPDEEFELPMSTPNRYLFESAYGYLGSTNIAWGSPNFVSLADQVCQFFVASVQEGASLGRALLEARQKFVSGNAPLGPHALKTLAQFVLLGDPSIHPIKASPKKPPKPVKVTSSFVDDIVDHVSKGIDFNSLFQKTVAKTTSVAAKSLEQRSDRRLSLFHKGLQLAEQIAAAATEPEKTSKNMMKLFKDSVTKATFDQIDQVTSYVVEEATDFANVKSMAAKKKASGGMTFMIGLIEQTVEDAILEISDSVRSRPEIKRLKMVVAKERDGTIQEVTEYHSR